MEEQWCDVDPNKLIFTFGGSYVCANFGENRSRKAIVRVRTKGYTDALIDANGFYNLSHAICYSYGADIIRLIYDRFTVKCRPQCILASHINVVSIRLSNGSG